MDKGGSDDIKQFSQVQDSCPGLSHSNMPSLCTRSSLTEYTSHLGPQIWRKQKVPEKEEIKPEKLKTKIINSFYWRKPLESCCTVPPLHKTSHHSPGYLEEKLVKFQILWFPAPCFCPIWSSNPCSSQHLYPD